MRPRPARGVEPALGDRRIDTSWATELTGTEVEGNLRPVHRRRVSRPASQELLHALSSISELYSRCVISIIFSIGCRV